MNKKRVIVLLCGFVCALNGMQFTNSSEALIERSTICFLHQYARAHFCDVDERGVYFNEIEADREQTTFTLPWNNVTAILKKAFEDIERFDLVKEQLSLPLDYKTVLQQIKEFHSLERYQDVGPDVQILVFNVLGENRNLYKGAWRSGDHELIKAALKLELFNPSLIRN